MTDYTVEQIARAYQEHIAAYDAWLEKYRNKERIRDRADKTARWYRVKEYLLSLDVGVEDASDG